MPQRDNHFFLHDVMFKIVFATEHGEIPLRALLNALLDLRGPDRIERVEVLNPGLDKATVEEYGAILDVKARDERGRQYNLEVQLRREPFFVERSVYYDSHYHGGQLIKKQEYDRLAPTVFIGLLDFIVFPEGDELHSSFSLRHDKTGRLLTDHLTFHYFELPHLGKNPPSTIATPAEAWLNLLKFGHLYLPGVVPLPVEIMREEGVAMAIDRLKNARSSEEDRFWAETRDKAERTHLTAVSQARKEGQHANQLDTARRMIAEGIDNAVIARITLLPLADIAALRKR